MKVVTKDIFEAAYLLSRGMQVARVFGNARTILLCIEGGDNLLEHKQAYRQGRALLNVKDFKREFKQVRDITFQKKRELQNQ